MNKGFTLIELLAVILVLSILTLITIVSVSPILKDAKKGLTDTQIENIKEVASLYYIKHGVGIDDFELENPKDCINVSELIETGYIENEEVTNPKTGEKILGSVKVTYNSNNYIYEYQDNVCTNYDKGIICERVENTELGNVPEGNFVAGDAYNCKVDPNSEIYTFYVLSYNDLNGNMTTDLTNAASINLLMDSNITRDGFSIKSNEYINLDNMANWHTAWVTAADYIQAGGTSIVVRDDESTIQAANDIGPVTAIKYLKEATKNWGNINKDKIRLPQKEEINNIFEDKSYSMKNFQLEKLPLWATNYLFNDEEQIIQFAQEQDYENKQFAYVEEKTHINMLGTYWLFDKVDSNNYSAYEVGIDGGYYGSSTVYADSSVYKGSTFAGVRPVISVYKFQME